MKKRTAATAFLPAKLEQGRAWGLAVNLYTLRSKRNWGIGDFTDLRGFVRLALALGADFVGVNPLHALHYNDPGAASPYSPTSRFFLNPIYIDVEAVPEFDHDDPRAAALRGRVGSAQFAEALAALRETPLVEYVRVARAKWSALEELYGAFRLRRGARAAAFRDFCEAGGPRLERFAVYEALGERFARARSGANGWPSWPAEYQDVRSEAVKAFAARNRRRVNYFKYLQWIADEQLAAAANAGSEMSIGLYRDVAVGVAPDSADVWSDRSAYVLDETVGAPPDPLGPLGQNWGLPPPVPSAMLGGGAASFAELLRSNMRHAGALRLDHAMALTRLFRIPQGRPASEGAYVAYPFDELLAIVEAESVRARCVVVGEDLGNVPEGFRERMERERILSYRLLLFEREFDGAFKSPEAYPRLALATGTTHDLPTLPGWALGRDIEARVRIGLLPAETAARARAERRVDASRLIDALARHGELDRESFQRLHAAIDARSAEPASYAPLVSAAYRYLADTPARLILVPLDDALCTFDQVNLPGTSGEYPNWRRKLAPGLDGIAVDVLVEAIAAQVRARVTQEPDRHSAQREEVST
ncbi:MAG: 4-alpha-glucanotransferase [Candidatus Baltobacteraceae bacterium]|jgi:4-alpha-glucanotransferase